MKLGLCTGGGDCPGLNAVIRAVVKYATGNLGATVIGIEDSFDGLFESPPRTRTVTPRDVAGILERGGTILGTSNKGSPFKGPDGGAAARNQIKAGFASLGLDALIVVGGDGTQGMASQIHAMGLPVIGIPKTIDNDFGPTDLSVGFLTAVDVAADAVSRLQSTAEAHDRIMVVEVMGRDAGYIALHAGIAGGAHIILLPEIPFTWEALTAKIASRQKDGRKFAVVVAAEGAFEKGKKPHFRTSASGSVHLGGIGDEVAGQLHQRTGVQTRVTVLGHIQRGGPPTAADRILATALGVHAVDLAVAKKHGRVACFKAGRVTDVRYEDFRRNPVGVPLTSDAIRAAEAIGICLGR